MANGQTDHTGGSWVKQIAPEAHFSGAMAMLKLSSARNTLVVNQLSQLRPAGT